jgi:hypothetical protein
MLAAATVTVFTVLGSVALVVIGAAQVFIAARENRLAERQSDAAERQAAVAERQLELANTQLDRERSAYLTAASVARSSSDAGLTFQIDVYNGGAHPARDAAFWLIDSDDQPLSDRVFRAMLAPHQTIGIELIHPRARGVDRIQRLRYSWADGLGGHEATVDLL